MKVVMIALMVAGVAAAASVARPELTAAVEGVVAASTATSRVVQAQRERAASGLGRTEEAYDCHLPRSGIASGVLTASTFAADGAPGVIFQQSWKYQLGQRPQDAMSMIVFANGSFPDGDDNSLMVIQTNRPDLNATYFWNPEIKSCQKQSLNQILISMGGNAEALPVYNADSGSLPTLYLTDFSGDFQVRLQTYQTGTGADGVPVCQPLTAFIVAEDPTAGTQVVHYSYANVTLDADLPDEQFAVPTFCTGL